MKIDIGFQKFAYGLWRDTLAMRERHVRMERAQLRFQPRA